MKKLQKGLIAAFSAMMIVCGGFGFMACEPTDEEPPVVTPVVPTLETVTADVTERPVGISVNECELLKVYFDGEELPDTHYVTRNGRFILAYETYGDELSVGEYEVKLSFTQGEASYTLCIVDTKEPECSFETEGLKTSYVKGDTIEFPLVERGNEYQSYDSVYTVYDEAGTVVQSFRNLEKSETEVVWNSLDEVLEEYTLKVTLERGGQTVKTFEDWKFGVQEFLGAAVFSEVSVGADGWTAAWENNSALTYNEQEKAVEFKNKNSVGMRSDYTVSTYPIDALKAAKQAGYEALSFSVKPNEVMANTPWFDLPTEVKSTWNAVSSSGLRIFAATKYIGEKVLVDGVPTRVRHNYVVWENDVNYISRLNNQGDGVVVYKDVYVTEMRKDAYTQVVIDLDEFLALSADTKTLSFAVGGVKGSALLAGGTSWLTQAELTAYEAAKVAADKTLYGAKNFAGEDMLYRWGVHSQTSYVTRSYDATANALKATVNTANGHSKAQTNIFALGALELKYAYEKLGFTHLTIRWRASKEMANPSTAITGAGRCVRLYTDVKTTAPSGTEINLPDLTTTTTTFEISLADVIDTRAARYLCFVIGGDVGDAVWFESMTLSTKA